MPSLSPQPEEFKPLQEPPCPFPDEAIQFVLDGLSHTVKEVHPQVGGLAGDGHHVSGQQLCMGLLDFALDKYGMLAPVVMEHWKVERTYDFGRIVFALVEDGRMRKTASDSLDDFRGVYDFAEVFAPGAMRRRVLEHAS